MLPVIALAGRPNVGKSTLFNYLTRSREALVADYPGLTRDRRYGRVKRGSLDYLVIDTGGLVDDAEGVEESAQKQVEYALMEADAVLFLVDAKGGISASDQTIAHRLRKLDKPVLLVANKIDGADADLAAADFHALALGAPIPISASSGRGVAELLQHVAGILPPQEKSDEERDGGIAIAVVGRPNVGKSTLVNRLLGEERVVVFDQPGTTRDSVYIPFERDGKKYTLIDTAGIRRRSKVSETVEKFSVIKTLQAIDKANVVIYLIDAQEGMTDQDAGLLGNVLEAGRALVIGINKWDGLDPEHKEIVKRQIDLKLPFLDFAEKHFISALHGSGVGGLFDVVRKIYDAAMLDLSTPSLSKILGEAVETHPPPLVRGRRIKLKYAHQGGHNPPIVVIHGNQTDAVPPSYKRYLMNYFRDRLGLTGTPVRIEFRASENPYQGRRNPLTERQTRKRKRLLRHVKKRK